MNKRPRSITIISWTFIAFGSIALFSGLLPYVYPTAAHFIAELKAHWYIHLARILAVLSGVLMLYGFNWGRWLLVVWLGFHVIIGALHSPTELLVHTLLFAVVLYFLFRAPASAYFRGTRAEPPEISRGTSR